MTRQQRTSSPDHQIVPVGGHSARQWCSTHSTYADTELTAGQAVQYTGPDQYITFQTHGSARPLLRGEWVNVVETPSGNAVMVRHPMDRTHWTVLRSDLRSRQDR